LAVKRTLAVGSGVVLVKNLDVEELLLEMSDCSDLAQNFVQIVEQEAVVKQELEWRHKKACWGSVKSSVGTSGCCGTEF